jgi:precorrin-6Y C5,15-methyltransferase (decarboxylating)
VAKKPLPFEPHIALYGKLMMHYINTVKVVGMGMSPDDLSMKALTLINEADVLIGGERHLAYFRHLPADKIPLQKNLQRVAPVIKRLLGKKRRIVVIASGDPGYFGIARTLIRQLGKETVEVIPNITAFQAAFAAIKENWEDALLLSAHGREIHRLAALLRKNDKIGILTDSRNSPGAIAVRALAEDPLLASVPVYVAERLGDPDEKIHHCRLKDLPGSGFASPNVMLLMPSARPQEKETKRAVSPGIPDDMFAHRRGLITKDEVRLFTLAKLNLPRRGIVWDIGSGSGSVAVEAALIAPELTIYAVEKNTRCVRDIRVNIKRFEVRSAVIPVPGEAPEALKGFPRPQRIFIGGSGGALLPVLRACCRALLPSGRMVINAATLETVDIAVGFFRKAGWSADVTLLNLSRMKRVGSHNRFEALNPVFVIAADRPGGGKKREKL